MSKPRQRCTSGAKTRKHGAITVEGRSRAETMVARRPGLSTLSGAAASKHLNPGIAIRSPASFASGAK